MCEDLVKEQKFANDLCKQFREDAKAFVESRTFACVVINCIVVCYL